MAAAVPFTPELPTRFPLAVEPSNRDATTNADARLVNGYVETHGKDIYVYRRPGLGLYSSTSSGTGRGIYNWQGDVYSVVNGTLYRNAVSVGSVVSSGFYSFDSVLGAVPKLVLSNGVQAYRFDVAGGLHPLTGVTPPVGNVPGWAFVDGTLYYMTPGAQIYGSGINDPTTWDADNFLTAQIEPDAGVALRKHLVYVLAFKTWTTEAFYDRGNATGSPLAPVQGALMTWGCADPYSIQNVDGKLLFLAKTKSGSVQVVMIDNLKAQVVSTKWIEKLFFNESAFTSIVSWGYKGAGHSFYVLTLRDLNLTLAYDLVEGLWTQWTDTNGNYMPIVSSTFVNTMSLLQHESNGNIYGMQENTNTDDGALVTWELYTPNFDAGIDVRKTLNTLRITGDVYPGSVIQARCNDYDYDPTKWTAFRDFDMSRERPTIVNCGTFYRRAYHLKHRLDTPVRVMSLDLQLSAGTL